MIENDVQKFSGKSEKFQNSKNFNEKSYDFSLKKKMIFFSHLKKNQKFSTFLYIFSVDRKKIFFVGVEKKEVEYTGVNQYI